MVGGWINPLQTLPQGLVFKFDFDFDFDPDPELDNYLYYNKTKTLRMFSLKMLFHNLCGFRQILKYYSFLGLQVSLLLHW